MSRLMLSVGLIVVGVGCSPRAEHTGGTRPGGEDDAKAITAPKPRGDNRPDGPNDSTRKSSDGSNKSVDDPGLKEAVAGVKYRDLKEGVGDPCPAGAEVTVHYTGWLENGEMFDSTREGPKTTGRPATFKLKGLIEGWQEGVPGMKKGGIRKLVLTAEMGYGMQGRPPMIPGGATLVFEVEMIDFAPAKNVVSGPGQPMPFDKSHGGTDDPDLRDIGEGLKIRDLKEGVGDPVKEGAAATLHYTGWTADGTVFDSSRTRGQPFEATLRSGTPKSVIVGWERGIPGMKKGGIRKLVIPAAMAYGDGGAGERIPGGATLIFEVELVK